MNFQQLQMELVRALRGTLSQQELSAKLGFRFNQVYRWESGQLNIRWKDFLSVCNCLTVDLKGSLEMFMDQSLNRLDAAFVIKSLKGMHSVDVLAKQLQRPKRVLNRWLLGQSEPYLKDVLQVFYITTSSVLEFSTVLAGQQPLPSFAKEIAQRKREREFHFRNPEFASLIRVFEFTEYEQLKTHSSAFIAGKINLKVADVNRLMDEALELGLIEKVKRKYKIVNKSLSTRGDLTGRKAILDYWMRRQIDGIQSMDALRQDQLCSSYCIFTTNQVTYDKIDELRSQFYRAMIGLLHHDDNRAARAPLDRVIVMQHNLMNVGKI